MLKSIAAALVILCLSQPVDAKDQREANSEVQQVRGTEAAPLFVIAEPKRLSAQEAERQKRQADEKASEDRKVVEFTGSLALWTALLFGATLLLAFGTGALVIVGFLQVKDAKNSIAAAVKAAEAAERSAEVSEKALRALEVPYLYPVDLAYDGAPYAYRIDFSVRNYGRSPAIITGSDVLARIFVTAGRGPILFERRKMYMVDGMIGGGETGVNLSFQNDVLSTHQDGITSGKYTLEFLISISHANVLGEKSQTGRWFVWNHERNCFVHGRQIWEPEVSGEIDRKT